MNINHLEKLEYYKILENLSNYCTTEYGKNLVKELLPSNEKLQVTSLLQETLEGINLSRRNSFPSFYDASDITVSLKQLESGQNLSTKTLLNLSNILKNAEELKSYFNKDFITSESFPILSDLFNMLYSNNSISSKIFSCILEEDVIDDRASKELYSIRRKKKNLEQEIRSKLNDMIHSSSYSKYIQEPIITIRNERFVIPVKEEYRSSVKGLIHDVSNAGSTVFIEPLSVFEMNNEIHELINSEIIEIERILFELSQLFVPIISQLKDDVDIIGKLDFIFAKGKFAKSINAIIPKVSDKKEIDLKNARHPLISKDTVVPITLSLGKDFSTLLITGPNTGGKTVTLKTVGLLTCMACSGLAIPCDENSSIYVFDNVFADIGDDQDITSSLSTFSSHMTNIVDILKNFTSESLILLDELGSGTDPLEGANLAISILEHIKEIGALTISTTHYPELKKYALATSGFENASVEFDVSTLTPTYRLLVGIPGKSNAFEISKKLGLDEKIIDNAKSHLSSKEIAFEDLLKSIYDDKALIEKEKEDITKELNQVTLLRKSLERDNQSLKSKEEELINNAKVKARNILLDAKEDANEIIKEMNSLAKENKLSNNADLSNLRNALNSKIKDIKIYGDNEEDSSMLKPEDIYLNMEVFVKTLKQPGIVVSHVSKSNEVQVQIGNMKTNVNIKYLEKLDNSKLDKNSSNKTNSTLNKNTSSSYGYANISKTKNAKSEINVIGYNVDEAIFVIDKFLDDCSLAKLQTVRIVHGKGTGKLRNGIHKFLKTNPHVKSFRLGSFGEGEMGVTVVELK